MLRLTLALALALPAAVLADSYTSGSWSARYSDASSATEYWDLSARLASGHFVFARFFITNEGPGKHTAAGIGTLVQPDGEVVPFRYGKREGEWTLSPDRKMIDIASLTLDLRRQPRHFEMDSDKRGIKVHLDFPADGPVVSAPPGGGGSHHLDVLEMAAPAEARIWATGMPEAVATAGAATLTHAWMDDSESDLVLRQLEIVMQGPELSVYATDFTRPGGQRWSWLAVRRDDQVIHRSEALKVEIAEERNAPYPLPERVEMSDAAVRLAASPTRELLRLDPIEVVPQPFRWILSLKMQPRRISGDAACKLELRRGEAQPVRSSSNA